MTDKKVKSLHEHRKKKNPPSLDDVARSVVKTQMEPMMSNANEEPRGLASGGFYLDDEEKEDGTK
jgi:hypothetical protein